MIGNMLGNIHGLRKKRRVYLDHASATPVLPEATRAVLRGYELGGNPGSIHAEGVAAKRMLQESRECIARELGVKAREIIFTSGATEANNIAILGLARSLDMAGKFAGTHWVVSSIEHDSVLECFAEIERLGGSVTHVDPDPRGIISTERITRALRPETVFVSIGWANNEIGVVQPIREIARAIHAYEEAHARTILFHTDAGQAPLYLSPQMHTLGVDLASFGSGKLYGPRGIGALYLHNRVTLAPISFGGSQERGLRAGTEVPALAAGFAEAFEIVGRERHAEGARLKTLRDMLAREIRAQIPDAVVNGSLPASRQGLEHALPHMLNISLPGIDTEYLTLALDTAGIAVATKSACRENGEKRSHVVEALGDVKNAASIGSPDVALAESGALVKEERAAHTLRFSLGRRTTERDITHTLLALVAALPHAKRMV